MPDSHLRDGTIKVSDKKNLKVCKNCQKLFSPNKDWQLFGSSKCRYDYHNRERILKEIKNVDI